jgi:hypothetical protein
MHTSTPVVRSSNIHFSHHRSLLSEQYNVAAVDLPQRLRSLTSAVPPKHDASNFDGSNEDTTASLNSFHWPVARSLIYEK